MLNYKVIRFSELSPSHWSGGTTTELLIYPNGSDFKSGRFDLRISIATVEVEESLFTSLPDVERTLLVLDGTLNLQHEGHHSVILNQFEMDSFKGDWKTRSVGKVTDFNVMTKNNTRSAVEVKRFEPGKMHLDFYPNELIFIHVGEGRLVTANFELSKGDSVVLYNVSLEKLEAEFIEKTVLIEVAANSIS